MPKLPSITANELIKALEKGGFKAVGQEESRVILKKQNNLTIIMPVHKDEIIGKGLLRKIIRDADLKLDEFIKLL